MAGWTRGKKSVVSVAFAPADLERIKQAAKRYGRTVSEYIRHASLERAEDRPATRVTRWSGRVSTDLPRNRTTVNGRCRVIATATTETY